MLSVEHIRVNKGINRTVIVTSFFHNLAGTSVKSNITHSFLYYDFEINAGTPS